MKKGSDPMNGLRRLTALLLAATGGAMLAGSGEVAALTLPLHGAKWLGMAVTLAAAWLLAKRTITGLAWVSRAMLGTLAALICLGFALPPMRSAVLETPSASAALVRGVAYGGFNAALLHPVLAGARDIPGRERRRHLIAACCMAGMLLLAGHALLQRHPALVGEALPFVRLMARLGRAGFWLSAAALYLAILTTLTVCIRSLGGGAMAMAGIVMVAALGFSGVVDAAYPLLGGGCAVMLMAMRLERVRNFRN